MQASVQRAIEKSMQLSFVSFNSFLNEIITSVIEGKNALKTIQQIDGGILFECFCERNINVKHVEKNHNIFFIAE